MGERLIGILVWHGGKWYVRRRLQRTRRKAAIAGVSALVVIGIVVATRHAAVRRGDPASG
jgi:hypothetical protein